MTSINSFDSSVQCEEFYTVDPEEMAEVLAAPAVDDDWAGYEDWSAQVETTLAPSTLYIDPKDGKVKHIPEPPSKGRIGGIEI
jgi:hypothetical protein